MLIEDLRKLLSNDAGEGRPPDQSLEWLYMIAAPGEEPPPIGSTHSDHQIRVARWMGKLMDKRHVNPTTCTTHGDKQCIMMPLPHHKRAICAHLDHARKTWIFTVIHHQDEHPSYSSEH